MKEESKYNIRYLGFESLADGSRRMAYAITCQDEPARQATVQIPGSVFTGPKRVTFQEGATIGYERLRRELVVGLRDPLTFQLAPDDVEQFRPRRRVAAAKRA